MNSKSQSSNNIITKNNSNKFKINYKSHSINQDNKHNTLEKDNLKGILDTKDNEIKQLEIKVIIILNLVR